MDCKLVYTCNAGVIGRFGEFNFFLDALHNWKAEHFSTMTQDMIDKTFLKGDEIPPEAIITTHYHRDHHSTDLIFDAVDRYPDTNLVLPWRDRKDQAGEYVLPNAEIKYQVLRHQTKRKNGKRVRDPALNYGYMIQSGGKTLLTTGDGSPCDKNIFKLVGDVHPDIALMDFAWFTTRAGRLTLAKLKPKQVVLFHIPFPEDDDMDFIDEVKEAIAQHGHHYTLRTLTEFMQEEDFTI